MNVFQVIKHEYNDDDGHYDEQPFESIVYTNEGVARSIADGLNAESILAHNKRVINDVDDRVGVWEQRGGRAAEPKPVRDKWGFLTYDYYSTVAIERYAEKHTFKGDVRDLDAIERFAGRDNSLTYYTVETLRVVGA